uniref:Uncharacterized protein n=1 Tax=Nymphaea colorata TaxID=210225 RepID=A0A5K0YQ07_9MAGN|nr:unnamed protein product [Nymphaea colorata]
MHTSVKNKSNAAIRRVALLSVGGDHGGPYIDVGVLQPVEDPAGVAQIGQSKCAEPDEFEDEELGPAETAGDEKGVDLLKVGEAGALLKQ